MQRCGITYPGPNGYLVLRPGFHGRQPEPRAWVPVYLVSLQMTSCWGRRPAQAQALGVDVFQCPLQMTSCWGIAQHRLRPWWWMCFSAPADDVMLGRHPAQAQALVVDVFQCPLLMMSCWRRHPAQAQALGINVFQCPLPLSLHCPLSGAFASILKGRGRNYLQSMKNLY